MVEPYMGWPNSATYLASLYLFQEPKIHEKVIALLKRAALTEQTMAGVVEKVQVVNKGEDVPTGVRNDVLVLDCWAEGDIQWQAVADMFERDLDITPDPVSNDLQRLLAEAIIEGNVVKFERKLDRGEYLKVDDVLQSFGGKWVKKAKGHVFPDDPTDLIEAVIETGTFARPKKADNFGFFPTPPALAKEMLQLAGVTPGARVLEPNGGDGAIAELVAEIVGHDNVVTMELQERNAEILRNKGFSPVVGDFLAQTPDATFQFVLMNPPFAKQQDIDHVQHAWKFLKPGGRLVAIMAASVTFRDNAKSRDFRAFLEEHGGEIRENPDGSFKSSGTGVRTVTVVVDKPQQAAQTQGSLANFWLEAA